jgi:hypothetical protein
MLSPRLQCMTTPTGVNLVPEVLQHSRIKKQSNIYTIESMNRSSVTSN